MDVRMMGPGLDSSYIDPQMNNQPLAFNANKGKPPMPIEGGSKKSRDDGSMGAFTARLLKIPPSERQNSMENQMNENYNLAQMQPQDGMGGMEHGNMGGGMGGGNMMMQGGGQGFYGGPMGGPMGPMMGGPMMGGPGGPEMMGMGNMMMFGGMGWGGGPMGGEGPGPMPMQPQREIIRLEKSVLYPPPPNAPLPSTRERPEGCRTIFVGGLPETATEEMLTELFAEFGAITSLRKSKKKNFAHVRYENETSVDSALFLSGYRMKVEDKDDKPNTGRLHVDFALARDDQYEFECKQRSLMRDMRHRQRMEEERLRPPSPPPITQYTDYESTALLEQLKSDEEFMKASQVLRTWLERGEVNRRNITNFYSLIQCTNSHIRRLLGEKQCHEEELTKMKEKFKTIFEGILRQFDQIEKIFELAQKQRNWDHFTKAQRKNIELWFKQAKEIKASQQEEFFSSRQEDEMEMSDEDDGNIVTMAPSASKKKKVEYSDNMTNQYAEMAGKLNQINVLKDENDTLKCQIEAYKNELAVAKQEGGQGSSPGDKKEVKSLQMAMQGMQQQLIQARNETMEQKKRADRDRADLVLQLQAEKDRAARAEMERQAEKERQKLEKDSTAAEKTDKEKEGSKDVEIVETPGASSKRLLAEDVTSSTGLHVTEKEAQLIGLVCCFLHVHPTGASLDYIWSYLHRLGIGCRVSELEVLLEKIPTIFRQEVTGVGATIERRWHFSGYKSIPLT